MQTTRHIFLLIYAISLLPSCYNFKKTLSTSQSHDKKLFLDINNEDFSKSAKEAVTYLKTSIANPNISLVTIQILSFHNGIREMQSTIQKESNSLTVTTLFLGGNESQDTSTKKIDIQDFVSQLKDLELKADEQIVIAGTYQKVYIQVDKEEKLFLTRKAHGLLSLLK